MNSPASSVLLLQAGSTLFMVGLIWFVQIVHYPLFSGVGVESFASYETDHNRLTSWVVVPPMLLECCTAILLLWFRPACISPQWVYAGLGLLVIVWASTFLLQVPQHVKLLQGFDAAAHTKLVASNWVRTIAWSARGALVCFMIQKAMR